MRNPANEAIRCVMAVCAAGLLATPLFAGAQAAADWPTRPVRFVTGGAAGSVLDARARQFGQHIAASLGQPIVVENRPGATNSIAAEAVAKAAPDGYTFLYGTASELALYLQLTDKPRYDPLRDFVAVAVPTSAGYLLLLTGPGTGASTVASLVEAAKSNPGKLTCGATGQLSVATFACSTFARMAGIDTLTVNYKAPAQVALAVASGEISMGFATLYDAVGHLRAAKIRALAVAGPKRLDVLDQVPSMTEAGYPGLEMFLWTMIVAPKGTSPAIVERMNREVIKASAHPEIREVVIGSGARVDPYTPEEARALLESQYAHWKELIAASGFRPQ